MFCIVDEFILQVFGYQKFVVYFQQVIQPW